jgi:pyruvate-formate lyase-activating enzyme
VRPGPGPPIRTRCVADADLVYLWAVSSIAEANATIVRALLRKAGVNTGAAPYRVRGVRGIVEGAAVDIGLETIGEAVRLRVENADAERPAMRRTPSFNVRWLRDAAPEGEMDQKTAQALDAFLRAFARADPGGLALSHGTGRARLPVVDAPYLNPRIDWSREVFDRAFAHLEARGVQAPQVIVVVTQACEMSCSFCPTADRVNIHLRVPDVDGQLADLIHQLTCARRLGARAVDFGGNDVLRYPAAVALFEAAGRLGYTRIVAQSPGQRLALRAFAEAVAASPLTDVALPIYGVDAASHDAITQKPGSFEGLLRALDNVRSLGSPHVSLHTIALAGNIDRLEEMLEFTEARWGLPLRVTCLRGNRLGESDHLKLTARLEDVRAIAKRHPARFVDEFPLCIFEPERAVDYASARLVDGGKAPLNLFDVGLVEGSADAGARAARMHEHPASCDACALRGACSGVLRSLLDRHGDADLKPIPDEPWVHERLGRVPHPAARTPGGH